jgi:propanol-preferring alcohol dehydrogenase
MRALRLTAWKHPAELVDVPEPEPGPGQALVRVAAAGACHSDLHLMEVFDTGLLPFEPPFTLGHENAGWVEAVGSGVQGWDVGQPVVVYGAWGCGRCHRCQQGAANYCERVAEVGTLGCGLGSDGGMAPLLLVPDARMLVPLTDLDPVDAAPLTDAGLTPYHAIKRSLPLLVPRSTAVVIGAGGLGHLAIQILHALTPARVVAVDTRTEALQLASDVGADHTVLADDSAPTRIRELTGGRGAELVLDLVGSDATLRLAAAVTGSMSHVTLVGIGGGTFPYGFFSQPFETALSTTYWGTLPELTEVIALAEAGHLTARVQRFPLEHADEAYTLMRKGDLHGRAVILPGH